MSSISANFMPHTSTFSLVQKEDCLFSLEFDFFSNHDYHYPLQNHRAMDGGNGTQCKSANVRWAYFVQVPPAEAMCILDPSLALVLKIQSIISYFFPFNSCLPSHFKILPHWSPHLKACLPLHSFFTLPSETFLKPKFAYVTLLLSPSKMSFCPSKESNALKWYTRPSIIWTLPDPQPPLTPHVPSCSTSFSDCSIRSWSLYSALLSCPLGRFLLLSSANGEKNGRPGSQKAITRMQGPAPWGPCLELSSPFLSSSSFKAHILNKEMIDNFLSFAHNAILQWAFLPLYCLPAHTSLLPCFAKRYASIYLVTQLLIWSPNLYSDC